GNFADLNIDSGSFLSWNNGNAPYIMGHVSSNTLKMSASGGNDIFIANTGKVGVGTATPGANLDVAGSINASAITINGTAIGTSSSPWLLNGSNAYYNGGYVGVGTSSPANLLDV